jgi:hypothetical protein
VAKASSNIFQNEAGLTPYEVYCLMWLKSSRDSLWWSLSTGHRVTATPVLPHAFPYHFCGCLCG